MTPRVALLVIGDGRDDLRTATIDSWHARVVDLDLVATVQVDDRHHEYGFCGAIRRGWEAIRAARAVDPFDFVFHLEEDWRFDRRVSIQRLADVLDADRSLCQVALRRGSENDVERAAGGLVGLWPHEYQECAVSTAALPGVPSETIEYLRHSLFFTTNPCLYHADLLDAYEWPLDEGCERIFGQRMVAEGLAFAFIGRRGDEPWVTHTGRGKRRGRGY